MEYHQVRVPSNSSPLRIFILIATLSPEPETRPKRIQRKGKEVQTICKRKVRLEEETEEETEDSTGLVLRSGRLSKKDEEGQEYKDNSVNIYNWRPIELKHFVL